MNVTFYSDVNATLLAAAETVLAGTMARNLDLSERLTLVVPWDCDCLTKITLKNVVRITDANSRVFEWRINTIADGRSASGDNTVILTCDPLILDFGQRGLLKDVVSGEYTSFNLGGNNITPTQYIETFVLPWITDQGLSWITGLGTVDFTDRYSIAWDRWTPLQLLQALADKTGGELDLRRSAGAYVLDLVAARNASAQTVLVNDGRNIIWLKRERRSDTLKTVMVPSGLVPSGDVEVSTLGRAAWKITNIAGTDITLADPLGGDGPVGFTDQLNGFYLLKPDATLTLISASTTGHVVTVASAAGLSVGDHVEIRADSSGTLLTELTNPTAVTTYGRVVGTVDDSTRRGERNHVPNPTLNTWTARNSVGRGAFSGAHAGATTINLKNMPVGLVIAVDDVLVWNTYTTANRITTGATVDGSGNATIVVTSAGSSTITASDGDPCEVWQLALPTGWNMSSARGVFGRYDHSIAGTLTGAANGTQTVVYSVVLKGLTAASKIQAGDVLTRTSGGSNTAVIVAPVTADGSGNATVYLGTAFSINNNDTISITRPTVSADVGAYSLVYFSAQPGGSRYFESPSYKVFATADTPTVWACVGFTLHHPLTGSVTIDGATYLNAILDIRDTAGGTSVASLTDQNRTLSAGSVTNAALRQSFALASSKSISLRFTPVVPVSASGASSPYTMIRWFSLSIGTDPYVPPVAGSHANDLWRLANSKLLDTSASEPATYTARIADLAVLNPNLTAESLDVGQSVRLLASNMAGEQALDVTVRITSIVFDLVDPTNTQVTFSTIPPRLTRALARAKIKKLYVNLNVTLDSTGTPVDPTTVTAGEQVTTVDTVAPTTENTPPTTVGATRATVPPSQVPTDPGTGAVVKSKYKRAA